jgi:hypothetical protein
MLTRARKQSPDVHARVLGGVELARIVGDESPRVRDLAALEVDDAKAAGRLDRGRASFASRNVETLADQPIIGRARRAQTLPANLLVAIGELECDEVLRAALGAGRGEDYVDYYAKVKPAEWSRYHEQVSDWEIKEYLTASPRVSVDPAAPPPRGVRRPIRSHTGR